MKAAVNTEAFQGEEKSHIHYKRKEKQVKEKQLPGLMTHKDRGIKYYLLILTQVFCALK